MRPILDNDQLKPEESDEESEDSDLGEAITDYSWTPALAIGSTFVETSVKDPNQIHEENMLNRGSDDYETMKFYQDSKGNHIGSFYVKSTVRASSEAIVAFWVYTSSKLEFELCPVQGFLAPGQS
jgi:hypothetical protein